MLNEEGAREAARRSAQDWSGVRPKWRFNDATLSPSPSPLTHSPSPFLPLSLSPSLSLKLSPIFEFHAPTNRAPRHKSTAHQMLEENYVNFALIVREQ